MPMTTPPTWALIIDGNTFLFLNNNNDENNNNTSTINNNITSSPCTDSCSGREESSSRSSEEHPNLDLQEDSTSFTGIDFNTLETIPLTLEEEEEKKEKEEEEKVLTHPSFSVFEEMDFEEESSPVFLGDPVDLFSSLTPETPHKSLCPESTDPLLSNCSEIPHPFLPTTSELLTLHTPSTPPLSSWDQITTSFTTSTITTTSTSIATSDATSLCIPTPSSSPFSFSSLSTSSCPTTVFSSSTSIMTPRTFSSPTDDASLSSVRDVSRSSVSSSASYSDVSIAEFDDMTSYEDLGDIQSAVEISCGEISSSIKGNVIRAATPPCSAVASNPTFSRDVTTSWGILTSSEEVISGVPAFSLISPAIQDSINTALGINDMNSSTSSQVIIANDSPLQCSDLPTEMVVEVVTPKKMADDKMAAATLEVLETGSLTPLIKEELKYTIQSRRLAAGKPELTAKDYAGSGGSGAASRTRRSDRTLTAEEREKHRKRRDQNRMAAQRFRQKQRDTEEILTKKCRKLEGSNSSLRAEIKRLARETRQLQQMMDSHLPHCHRPEN